MSSDTVSNQESREDAPSKQQVSPPIKKGWVHFDEENSGPNKDDTPAVINTENVQVNLSTSVQENNVAVVDPKPLRTVELPVATIEPIRQGFCK